MFSFNEEAENATQVLNATEHSIAAADGPSFLPAGIDYQELNIVCLFLIFIHFALLGYKIGENY